MKPNFKQNYKGMRCRVCLVSENTGDEIIKINNESAVYELVKDDLQFAFFSRGKVKAKNKGEIEMYFVETKVLIMSAVM